MAPVLEALEQAFDGQEEALGQRVTATIGEVTADALVSQIEADILPVPGGTADAGGYTLQMRVSDFETAPAKFEPVQITGRTDANLKVVNVTETGGVYTITVGDPAAENS